MPDLSLVSEKGVQQDETRRVEYFSSVLSAELQKINCNNAHSYVCLWDILVLIVISPSQVLIVIKLNFLQLKRVIVVEVAI